MKKQALTIYLKREDAELLAALNPGGDTEAFAADMMTDGLALLGDEQARREGPAEWDEDPAP